MLIQTASQTVGPFFYDGLIHKDDNVLVNEMTAGERILLTGYVLDGDGQGVEDAMVEIWQADARGCFNHPADPRVADPSFGGFGRSDTPGGKFWFKTIKPGPVLGANEEEQAPFINVRVFARGMLLHAVTRIYFSDEDSNGTDPVLTSVDETRRVTLIAQRDEFGDLPHYYFNIVLQGENETIFFDS